VEKKMFEAEITVTLKKAILDPQGKAILNALHSLGFDGVEDVRVGKYFALQVQDGDRDALDQKVREMTEKLLVNPIIETYTYTIEEKVAS